MSPKPMPRPREEALALQQRAMRDWVRMLAECSPDGRTIELDGVTAVVCPSVPQRSIVNSVVYSDPDALADRLEDLASAYDEAGIIAWTVWVPDFEAATIALLEAAGHEFDGKPAAMSLNLDALRAVDVGDLDYERGADPGLLGPLNQAAYGDAAIGFAEALATPPDTATIWAARNEPDGEAACVVATLDHEDDLGLYFVATHPDHRGRGLASRLLTVVLTDARDRGLRTSSLQGSKMGTPVYERLGYSTDFALHMYERRRPA
jgi:GNAT superfamily N-acetyltransferase